MEDFFKKLNSLLKDGKLDETKKFLEDSLETAINSKDSNMILAILNELVGFYRDITQYDEALKYAKAILPLIEKLGLKNTIYHVKSLINIANIKRFSNNIYESINISKNAITIYEENNLNDSITKASIYNNLALAYQQKENYSDAITYLNNAIEIIKKENDEIKLATSYSNLSLCYLKMNNLDKAEFYLNKAKLVFEQNKNDFHFTGFLSNLAEFYYLKNKLEKAKETYEMACAYLLKNTGYSLSYYTIRDNLFKVYDALNISHHKQGLILAKEYYEKYFEKQIDSLPSKIKENMIVGLFGYGSECYKESDIISEDHDFDQGFIVLLDKSVSKEDFNYIKSIYENMPLIFERYYRFNNKRKGVFYLDDYLNYLVSTNNYREINNLTEEDISLLTNGEIWYDPKNTFKDLRSKLLESMEESYLKRIIENTLYIGQTYQYNLPRIEKRNDILTYDYLLYDLPNTILKLLYTINHTPLPHPKIRMKLASKLRFKSYFFKAIEALYNKNLESKDISDFIKLILLILKREGLIANISSFYICDYKDEMIKNYEYAKKKIYIIKKIINYEWQMLQTTINEGGRANCQDNIEYFTLMRKSQFMAWNIELLESYFNDLKEAFILNRNLITEKYAYMEKVRDPEFYNNVTKYLPKHDKKRTSLQEEIIKVQLDMLLEFKKDNNSIVSNMRTIYSKDDSMQEISYETYLRGELSTYSERTLIEYAKQIINCEKNNINLVKTIIDNSFYLLGNEKL